MIVTVHCPHCGNFMVYNPVKSISGKSKKCVYCNRSFKAEDHIAASKPVPKTTEFRQA